MEYNFGSFKGGHWCETKIGANKILPISLGEASLKKIGKIWEKFPKGGLKNQTKIPNFNLGSVITQGGGVSIFQKITTRLR